MKNYEINADTLALIPINNRIRTIPTNESVYYQYAEFFCTFCGNPVNSYSGAGMNNKTLPTLQFRVNLYLKGQFA